VNHRDVQLLVGFGCVEQDVTQTLSLQNRRGQEHQGSPERQPDDEIRSCLRSQNAYFFQTSENKSRKDKQIGEISTLTKGLSDLKKTFLNAVAKNKACDAETTKKPRGWFPAAFTIVSRITDGSVPQFINR
jgi:hypothetical protein